MTDWINLKTRDGSASKTWITSHALADLKRESPGAAATMTTPDGREFIMTLDEHLAMQEAV